MCNLLVWIVGALSCGQAAHGEHDPKLCDHLVPEVSLLSNADEVGDESDEYYLTLKRLLFKRNVDGRKSTAITSHLQVACLPSFDPEWGFTIGSYNEAQSDGSLKRRFLVDLRVLNQPLTLPLKQQDATVQRYVANIGDQAAKEVESLWFKYLMDVRCPVHRETPSVEPVDIYKFTKFDIERGALSGETYGLPAGKDLRPRLGELIGLTRLVRHFAEEPPAARVKLNDLIVDRTRQALKLWQTARKP